MAEETLTTDNFLKLQDALETIRRHKTRGMNIFSAVGMTRQEVKHSAFLAWLLTPFKGTEQHGLGNVFLRRWLERLFTQGDGDGTERSNRQILAPEMQSIDDFDDLLSADDVKVETERVILSPDSRIDILITSQTARTVIVIENKVGTTAHDGQLRRYEEDEIGQNAVWDGWKKVFVYLTPRGEFPYEEENGAMLYKSSWCVYSYESILEILRETKKTLGKSRAQNKLKFLMEDYIEMVDSEILQKNGELRALCKKIGRQYRDELEILAAYMKDNLPDIVQYCKRRLEERLPDVVFLSVSDSRLEFVTREIDDYFAEELHTAAVPPVRIRIAALKGDADITLFLENRTGCESDWTEKQRQFAVLAGNTVAGKSKYCTLFRRILLPEDARQGDLSEAQKETIDENLTLFLQTVAPLRDKLS